MTNYDILSKFYVVDIGKNINKKKKKKKKKVEFCRSVC